MLNKIIVMGRLTRDPELRHTGSGTAVTSFSVAVDRDFKDKNTGKRDTDWVTVTAWRGTAELVCKYFGKGSLIAVAGQLRENRWQDKDGGKHSRLEVVATEVHFCGGKREKKPEGNADENAFPPEPEQNYEEMDEDGELPF